MSTKDIFPVLEISRKDILDFYRLKRFKMPFKDKKTLQTKVCGVCSEKYLNDPYREFS